MTQSLTSRGNLSAYDTRALTQGCEWKQATQPGTAVFPSTRGSIGEEKCPRAGGSRGAGQTPPARLHSLSPATATAFPTETLRVHPAPPHGARPVRPCRGPGGFPATTGGEPRGRREGTDTFAAASRAGRASPRRAPATDERSGAERSRRGRTALPTSPLAGRRAARVTAGRAGLAEP